MTSGNRSRMTSGNRSRTTSGDRSRVKATLCAGAGLAVAATSAPALAQAPAPAPTWTAPPPGTVAPPAQPAPSPHPPDMQAGGLTPPPATTQTGPTAPPVQSQTEKDLEEAKKKDSKRGLEWFWFNAEGGFSMVDMRTFVGNEDFTFGFVPTQATGGTVGAGVGFRLLILTIGARGRIGLFEPWHMFTVGPEIGLHIPLGRVEPHFELGGGYAALGSVQGVVQGASDAISIQGGYARLSGGLDVYVTPWFSVGLLASGDFLAMVRPGISAQQIADFKADIAADPSIPAAEQAARQEAADGLGLEGSSYGIAWGVTGVLGLHF